MPRLKKHLKKYWFFCMYFTIVIIGIIGIAVLDYYAGRPENMWWRWQK